MNTTVRQFAASIRLALAVLPACAFAQEPAAPAITPPVAAAQTVERVELPPGVRVVVSGHSLPESSYTLFVQEVGSDTPLLAVNPDLPLNPASTIKTLTTLAGLDMLGANYTWETELYTLGPVQDGTLQGDLLLRGGGDPFLVEEYFRNMLKALHRRGVTRITGDLVIDASYFDAGVTAEAMIDNDTDRTYNVRPHAMMVNFQAVNFFFYPHANGSDVIIRTDPELPNLEIVNRLQLTEAACGGFQRGVSFRDDPANPNAVIFEGRYPSRCTEFVLPRAVMDAPNYAYGMFRRLYQEIGGEFAGNLRLGTAPENQEPLVTWSSPPLGDVIKSINKFSNNLMTRHLLLTLGAERFGTPATVESGVQAVHEYLDGLGIKHEGLELMNGAGLSREARVTSRTMNAVLQHGYEISTMPEFLASLPLNGVDGTMRNRLRDNGTRGNMHVKTGSLEGVAGVAGYVHARSGRDYVVVGILNHASADDGPGIELMDALLGWTYQQ